MTSRRWWKSAVCAAGRGRAGPSPAGPGRRRGAGLRAAVAPGPDHRPHLGHHRSTQGRASAAPPGASRRSRRSSTGCHSAPRPGAAGGPDLPHVGLRRAAAVPGPAVDHGPPETLRRPASARTALRHHRCDGLFAVPVMAQRLLALSSDDLDAAGRGEGRARPGRLGGSDLRVVALSGSALPAGFATRFMADYGPVLYNLYGSTEASSVSVADPTDLTADAASAGRPPRGTVVRIVDEGGEEVRDGSIGRIFVGNDMIFVGYTHGEARPSWRGLVPTGDLGRWVGGRLRVEGREDDIVVWVARTSIPASSRPLSRCCPRSWRSVSSACPTRSSASGWWPASCSTPSPPRHRRADRAGPARTSRGTPCRASRLVAELPRNATGKVLVSELRHAIAEG